MSGRDTIAFVVMRPHVALSEARSRAGRRTIGSSSFVDRRDERCCIARKAFPAAQLQMEPSFTSSGKGDTRLWEVAVLFHLRDAFRSGDVWLAHSRRYGDLKQVLVPMIAAQENAKLAVPSNPQDWLADRKARLTIALKRLARAARNGTIPHGSIEDGTLRIDRLTADVPDGALLQIVGGDKLIIPFADGAAHEPIQRPAFSA